MESYVCNLYLYSTLYRVVRELWAGKKGVGLGPAHISCITQYLYSKMEKSVIKMFYYICYLYLPHIPLGRYCANQCPHQQNIFTGNGLAVVSILITWNKINN